MKASFYTLGCKLNQCESEALAHEFLSRGFFVVPLSDRPDLAVINTCTVTSKAEQKARRILKKLASEFPQTVLIVTGCYAQMAQNEIEATVPGAVIVGADQKTGLLDLPQFLLTDCPSGEPLKLSVKRFFSKTTSSDRDRFAFESAPGLYHIRSFIKVQDGCNNACRYCRVTLARGDSVSLSAEEVLKRIRNAEKSGASEIVLTGVNLSQYRDGDRDLSGLISLVSRAVTSARLRLSSIEPDYVDEKFAEAVAHPNVCPHFHLALQSGSTPVLKRMGRHYDTQTAAEAIRLLKTAKDDPFLAADVITGFDGETDDEFLETEQFIADNGFHTLHVFPFSPRPGTPAAVPVNPVPERIRDERAMRLRRYSRSAWNAYREKWGSRISDIVIEEVCRLNNGHFRYEALSDRYLHFRFESEKKYEKGIRLGNFFSDHLDFFY